MATTIKILLNKKQSQIGPLAAANLAVKDYPIVVEWGETNSNVVFLNGVKTPFNETNDIVRLIARHAIKLKLYGASDVEASWVDHWLTFTQTFLLDVKGNLQYLDKMLAPVTYLVGDQLTIADLVLFDIVQKTVFVSELKELNVRRWAEYIITEPCVQYAIAVNKVSVFYETNPKKEDIVQQPKPIERKQEGKFVDLPGAEMGKVVVRFPPEASGYLHIGHAKAALLNQYYQQAFQGKLIMRFDDTNPAKETIEFENVILEDLKMLEIKPDLFTHTSQYFDIMLGYCETLLKEGKAYVDDTEAEQMKLEREQKTESPNRNNSAEKNFEMWREMLEGSERGQKCCVRAKIDMTSDNGCMRDPTIYRCKNEPHPRTGTQYKVYPTYDFACPIVDAIENVTHTLRTTEYLDRDDQFYWFIDALKLRKPYIWAYSRLNMTNTVLSKRKLTWFVNNGHVSGWDDPRFPTVRGILRRGMTVKGLKEFIIAQGSSKSVVFMEWDKIWAFNKKVIDPIAPRHTALDKSTVAVFVDGVDEEEIVVPLHPKDPEVGTKKIFIGPNVVIEQEDADQLKVGDFATFINWGNMLVDKLVHENGKVVAVYVTPRLDNRDFKKTLKLTWLCNRIHIEFPRVCCVYFQHIISKPVLGKNEDFKDFINEESRIEVPMYGCPALMKCKKGDIIQLTRRGFFKVDSAYEEPSEFSGLPGPIVLFEIPDGHTKEKVAGGLTKKDADPKPNIGELCKALLEHSNWLSNLLLSDVPQILLDVATTKMSHLESEHYKHTGIAWEPPLHCPPDDQEYPAAIYMSIVRQYTLRTSLSASCTDQDQIKAAQNRLNHLKAQLNQSFGIDFQLPTDHCRKSCYDTDRFVIALNTMIYNEIVIMTDLKANKAPLTEFENHLTLIKELMKEFRKFAITSWTLNVIFDLGIPPPRLVSGKADEINKRIIVQGDLVRALKASKAAKPALDAAVKSLLELKAEFKVASGKDWSPTDSAVVTAKPNSDLDAQIVKQGDLVRDLKAKKAAKPELDAAVKVLLQLKADFKAATGQDWKPTTAAPVAAASVTNNDLNDKITKQGDLVRDLKAKKAAKPELDAAVKVLLQLKADFKAATGQDWKPSTAAPAAVAASPSPSNDLNDKITKQGDLVRDLKAKKAAKPEVDAAVKLLLQLKSDFKAATGQDWKPTTAASVAAAQTSAAPSTQNNDLNDKITKQGELVRDLKSKKAAKPEVDAAVMVLLGLKAEFKAATGQDWKPPTATSPPPATPKPSVSPVVPAGNDLNDLITKQGDLVRELKAKKAAKPEIDAAVKSLLELKAQYKMASGQDWKPTTTPPASVAKPASAGSDVSDKVAKQGDLVRELKAKKASKAEIDDAVKTLLSLKAQFKEATGQDWKPSVATTTPAKPEPATAAISSPALSPEVSKIDSAITAQGNLVRDLKTKNADKSEVDAAVKVLLGLKAEFKAASGADWKPAQEPKKPKAKAEPKPKPAAVKAPTSSTGAGDDKGGVKKQTRLGLEASKWENLPDWYSQVITKSEMIEYYDVSGCYILRPLSISIWRSIQNFFQDEITKLGVKECYFPMFVSKAALEKEKDHIADFSPEVAWVTKSGDSDLAEPIAIRPTSETIMYPAFAKWIQSYRDLPLKLNQWSNVVRWEFKHPQPFLRTREFLWQEGHTAFATAKEADAEVLDILELYARIYEELLAIPVRRGRKSEKEKFAGGDYTTTVEAYVSASGRSIQGATSHHLGQNFSKMFDIIYEDPLTQEKKYVYQNSWGLTTRTIGVMVMVHGDDKGLIIPPRVAPVQAVVVPCGLTVNTTDAEREVLQKSCTDLENTLRSAGIRVEGDYRDNYSPGWKFNHWELKGTPIRIELGPKDIKSNQLVLVRRDTAEKVVVPRAEVSAKVADILDAIQKNLFAKAQKDFDEHLVLTRDWTEFCANLEKKNVLCSPFCGVPDCEDLIKDNSAITDAVEPGAMLTGAKSLCIPFKQPADILPTDKCIHPACTRVPKYWTYFGRSY